MTVTGLRQRLEALEGVSSIQLELGEGGLSGIRVTLAEGADEAMVLERIRAMLVTYGLRAPEQLASTPVIDVEAAEFVADLGEEGDRLRVEVRGGGEEVVLVVDPTPLAAARAIAEARARLAGAPPAEVLWIGLDQVGSWRVLTVLAARDENRVQAGAAVVGDDWAAALNRAVAAATD